jgi:hypothetical protein
VKLIILSRSMPSTHCGGSTWTTATGCATHDRKKMYVMYLSGSNQPRPKTNSPCQCLVKSNDTTITRARPIIHSFREKPWAVLWSMTSKKEWMIGRTLTIAAEHNDKFNLGDPVNEITLQPSGAEYNYDRYLVLNTGD